jgi:2,3-bisphosphoglycerate-independent phosphoglycerate mutase
MKHPKPLALIILDGFGYREEDSHNAINHAKTPNIDALLAEHPNILISGSGKDVGLPDTQMGNSEVGHMNLGAGRIIYQDLTRIDKAVAGKKLARNKSIKKLINTTKANNGNLHIMGLLSDGGVHSHIRHIQAMADTASEAGINVYLHAFLDGRDTPPKSAKPYLQSMKNCTIASMAGRFFAMDRDNNWARVQAAYEMITQGKADFSAENAVDALEAAYARGEKDEFVEPTVIHAAGAPAVKLEAGDGIIFMNFRADRARQLCRAFLQPDFTDFKKAPLAKLSGFVTLTQYAEDIPADVAFAPLEIANSFSDVLVKHKKTQLRIAETEKYAHVTFFFSCGNEKLVAGEARELIPSPDVTTYDQKPEMSAFEVTEKLVEAIESKSYDVIICNFANPDMVGHTGDFAATVKAIEAIDKCIGRIIAALRKVKGECLITADHGNAEQMFNDETQQAHTAHTSELVPLIYFGRDAEFTQGRGILADIAPTMLYLLNLPIPKEMTGKVLLKCAK